MRPPYYLILFANFCLVLGEVDWKNIGLVREHVPMVLFNNAWLKKECNFDGHCPYKEFLSTDLCWGYENDCKNSYLPDFGKCENDKAKYRYWMQGDFGKLRGYLDEIKSGQLCEPKTTSSTSYLMCAREAKMCQAKNLYLHLPSLSERDKHSILVPQNGVIGSYCNLNKRSLEEQTSVKRSLSTWGHQLQSFSELGFDPFDGDKEQCDVVFERPVVFVQLDAMGNLYHHFCDFFNLYLTQHTNNSWFGTDVQIIRWGDHYRFRDPFMDAWSAFTDHEVLSLRDFVGKKLCLPDVTFALLPRMAHGLYYSTYLDQTCRGSALMKSFSDHFLFRMNITDDAKDAVDTIRITFLQRGSNQTKYPVFRRVVNADALVKRLRKVPNATVKVVSFDHGEMNFLEQLQITRNTDIFIGMHGAGLAHFMFLPDWAVAFELYNCGDIRCYRDLAGLRGVTYMTWEDASKVTEHDKDGHERYSGNSKFWNYSFDVEEFIRLVSKARDTLLEHNRFRHFQRSIEKDKQEL